MQTLFCSELKLQSELERYGLATFIPQKYEPVVTDDGKRYVERPAIRNLVFIRSTKEILNSVKEKIGLSFRYISECGSKEPAIISDEEMNTFIRVTELAKEHILYLKDNFEHFKAYSHVRVTGGRFEGVEGYLVRIKRDRKVVLLLKDISAVAISGIDRSLIELVKE